MNIASRIVVATGLICGAATAQSQGALDPPRYDSSILCYQRATVAEGFSAEAMTQCLAQQRKSYDAIRRRWNQLPEEIQTGCDEQTRATRVLDYQSLESCIETQLRRIPPGPEYEFPSSRPGPLL